MLPTHSPSVETLGYYQMSLRDNRVRSNGEIFDVQMLVALGVLAGEFRRAGKSERPTAEALK